MTSQESEGPEGVERGLWNCLTMWPSRGIHRQEGTLPSKMPLLSLVVNCRDRLLGRARCADRFLYGLGLPHLLLLRINEVVDRLLAVSALDSGNPSGRCRR